MKDLLVFLVICVLLAFCSFFLVGCDEGVDMVGDVITEPTETAEPIMNGEVKKPEDPTDIEDSVDTNNPIDTEDLTPEPTPTLTVDTAATDDGSITVSGASTHLPAGTTVTVTIGDTVTVTTTTDEAGNWTATVPADEAEQLAAGETTVTAETAGADPATGSLVIPEPLSEEEQLEAEFRQEYEQYNFSEETVDRLVRSEMEKERSRKAKSAGEISRDELVERIISLNEEAYGISSDYAATLRDIYVEERPEEKYLLRGADFESIGIAYLIVKEANPDAEGEEFEELFRQAAREGAISISSPFHNNN